MAAESADALDPAAFLDRLRAAEQAADGEVGDDLYGVAEDAASRHVVEHELVIDKATGKVRQAGAAPAHGGEATFVMAQRVRAQGSLYFFSKFIMGRAYLTNRFHKPCCDRLQTCPPFRKMELWPREHAKSTIVSQCLPIHMHIQPRDHNVYFPGEEGSDIAIVLAGEKLDLMKGHIRVQQSAWMTNDLIRAFWPHRTWGNVKRDAPLWNASEYVIPRQTEQSDPSVRALGVDAAIAGAHPRVLIKDDLISLAAANSEIVMQAAIEWHIASQALVNRTGCLEFVIGTKWAVHDLYSYIQQNDATFEPVIRAVVENGRPIYAKGDITGGPLEQQKGFDDEKIADCRSRYKNLFYLNYMNSASVPELADFPVESARYYRLEGDTIVYETDPRDAGLVTLGEGPKRAPTTGVHSDQRFAGYRLSKETLEMLRSRDEFVRFVRA